MTLRSVCIAVIALFAFPSAMAGAAGDGPQLVDRHLIAIGGGRHLNMVCMGEGSPTVVFEYGLGSHMLHWQRVAEPVAAFTRACFYDPAGYGYSDPSTRPMSAENITSELHALLKAAGIAGPVVLAGHSLGGLYATLYADRFPSDVAGLVLIDPSFAGQDDGESADQVQRDETAYRTFQVDARRCQDLARAGQLTEAAPHDCFALAPGRARNEIDFLMDQFLKPFRYRAVLSENANHHRSRYAPNEDDAEEQHAARSFGDMPVIVLTAGVDQPDPAATEAERNAAAARWKAGHDALAARSTRGENIVVPKSGHYIQIEQPQAVIDAIRKVVLGVRGLGAISP